MMLRVFLLLLCMAGVNSAIAGLFDTTKTFKVIKDKPEYSYRGEEILLNVDGTSFVIPVTAIGANWWDVVSWTGIIDNKYNVSVLCDEPKILTGKRVCTLKQAKNCQWDSKKNVCISSIFEPFDKQEIAAPATFYAEGSTSRLTGKFSDDALYLYFENNLLVSVPSKSILRGDYNTRYYQGEIQGISAEVSCKSSNVGSSGRRVECQAYRNIHSHNGDVSGFDNKYASMGKAVVMWDESVYQKTKDYTDHFYLVGQWPRLNPNKPDEVPEPLNNKKSSISPILQKEWSSWGN